MPKGGKKRRSSRNKKKKQPMAHVQQSEPSEKGESHPLEHRENDDFSPRTPVRGSELEEKDGMCDAEVGSASSRTKEVMLCEGVKCESGSLENLGFPEFSAYMTEDMEDSDVLERITERSGPVHVAPKGMDPPEKSLDWDSSWRMNDRHGSLQLSHEEEGDKGNGGFSYRFIVDFGVASSQSKDEASDKREQFFKDMHHWDGSRENLDLHVLSASQLKDFTASRRVQDGSIYSLTPSEGLGSMGSCGETESAMPCEDGVYWLSEEQNEYVLDALLDDIGSCAAEGSNLCKDENGYKDRDMFTAMLKGAQYDNKSIENLGSHEFSISQSGMAHGFLVPQDADSSPSERLEVSSETSESTTDFDQGLSINSSQGLVRSVSCGKLDSTFLDDNEGIVLPQEQNEYVKCFVLDNLELDNPETSTQLVDELAGRHRLSQCADGSLECLDTYQPPLHQAHDLSLCQRLEIGPGEHDGLQSLQEQDGCGKETILDDFESSAAKMLQSADGVYSLSKEQNEQEKDVILNNFEPVAGEGDNPSKYEIGYKDSEMLEEVHEIRSIDNLGSRGFYVSRVGALTCSERLISHAFVVSQADDHRPSETIEMALNSTDSTSYFDSGFAMSSSEWVMKFVSPRKTDSAICNGNQGFQLPLEETEHVKDLISDNLQQDDAETSNRLKAGLVDMDDLSQCTNGSLEELKTHGSRSYQSLNLSLSEVEILPGEHDGLQLLQKQDEHAKETILDNSKSSVNEHLQSAGCSKPDAFSAQQVLENIVDPQLLHKEYIDEEDSISNSSESNSVESRNQPKAGTVEDVKGQGTLTDMLKEDPCFEGLVEAFPPIRPTMDTAKPLIPGHFESKEFSGVVLQDAQVTLKEKSKDDEGMDPKSTSKEHAHETYPVKQNGKEKDIHADNILPRELDRGDKENDQALQSNEKGGTLRLGLWGILEFLLCWRD